MQGMLINIQCNIGLHKNVWAKGPKKKTLRFTAMQCQQCERKAYNWGPKTQNLFIRNCVFILTYLNSSDLQSALYLMQYTYGDIFSTAQNSFGIRQFWCLQGFCCFLFHLFCISKMFPSEDFFHPGKQTNKKVAGDQIG